MAKRMTASSADQLASAVELAQQHLDAGDSPTDAVVKAAKALQLPREMIRLTAHAHNIAQQTALHKSADDILARLQDHPLADGQVAIERVYGEKQASLAEKQHHSVVSPVYGAPPPRIVEKAATLAEVPALTPPKSTTPMYAAGMTTGSGIRQAIKQSRAIEREVEEAWNATFPHRDLFLRRLEKLATHFRQQNDPFEAFLTADHFATRVFPEKAAAVAAVMDGIAAKLQDGRHTVKRAAADGGQGGLVEAHAGVMPYCLINDVVNAAEQWVIAGDHHAELRDTMVEKIATLMAPYDHSLDDAPCVLVGHREMWNKASSGMINGMLGGAAASSLADNLAGTRLGKSVDSLTSDARSEFESASHANDLRAIDAQVLLHDMMHNDEVLSGYDPQEIMHAYNQISDIGPRLATHSLTIRPLLHKMMSQGGKLDPHDVEQIISLDNSMARRDLPKSAAIWDQPQSVLA
jgi:hypothetical protein